MSGKYKIFLWGYIILTLKSLSVAIGNFQLCRQSIWIYKVSLTKANVCYKKKLDYLSQSKTMYYSFLIHLFTPQQLSAYLADGRLGKSKKEVVRVIYCCITN